MASSAMADDSKPYRAPLMYYATIPLSADVEPQGRSPLSIATEVPLRRIDIHAGKMSAVDFFDVNGAGSDSHLQFMNWTVDDNGAFDYAADTRGYTWGAVVEMHEPSWSLRGGLMLMPVVANGIKLDHNVRRARGMNLEYELRRPLVPNHGSVLRLLVFENIAGMGNYRNSNALARPAGTTPDITATRRQGRTKYGMGVNVEQEIAVGARLFGRLGWSDGRNESYAYTEVDRTVELGFDAFVPHRRQDKIGVAIVSNGIAAVHREYLAAGGLGFLLGDGSLRYGPEVIVEAYYTAKVAPGVHLSIDVQHIDDPGYNRDRGPVWVESARFHVDF
jgi:high affinity Mn2+ porin